MDLAGFYATQNKSDRERQIVYDLTYMCNQKNLKWMNKENNWETNIYTQRTNIHTQEKYIHKYIYIRETPCGDHRKGEGGAGDEWNRWRALRSTHF